MTVQWFKNEATNPSETTSSVTDANGVARVTSSTLKGASSIAVCVVDLSGSGFVADPRQFPVCSSNYGSGGSSGPGGTPVLTSAVLIQKGNGPVKAYLSWTGGEAAVDVYHNGALVADATTNTGSYTDNLGKNPLGPHVYQVCNDGAGSSECSDQVPATGP